MNIWIFQHYATPPDTVSGTRHFNLAKMLIENGHDCTIFACSFNHSTFKEERLECKEVFRIEYIQGVRFFWIKAPSYKGNDWKRMLNMLTYAARAYMKSKRLNQVPTIIWASNPHLFSGLTGYLLAKKYNAHFLFEVRDLWPQVFVDIGAFSSRHPVVILLKLIERFLYHRAEKIITLMGKATDYIESCGVERSKIVHIPHGVDVNLFHNAKGELSPEIIDPVKRFKAQGKLIVGYLGAHGIADALDSVLDCCSILQTQGREDIHFVLIGHGSEKQRLEKMANEMKLTNISFYPAISKNTVPSAIKLFDVAIVSKKNSPLYKYGTSFIKTFDYMASGVPIIWAVNSPDCPVIEAHSGIAIPAEQPGRLAEVVSSFAQMDEGMRKEMGQRGLQYVRAYHGNDVIWGEIKSLLESISNEPLIKKI